MIYKHKPLHVSLLALLLICVISILSFQSGLAQDEITSQETAQQTSPTDILCGPTRFVGGNITEDTYWDPGYVYVLNSSVVVQPGVTLRVVANVVKAKPGTSITVNGKLIVLGTESSPRYFTSWKDDTLCGDTNGDGSATAPGTNDWGFIMFGSSSDPASIVQRAVIRYGGYGLDGPVWWLWSRRWLGARRRHPPQQRLTDPRPYYLLQELSKRR